MKDILPFYEREHANLSILIREFGEQYPQLASSLGFVEGKCEDPNVQRIVEAMVMMGARILQQLEDSYPQFTGALLNMNYPHYTQPFPSASIARFDYGMADAKAMSAVTTIPRGSTLNSGARDDVICRFRTAYPVTIAPVVLSHVAFHQVFSAPGYVRVPEGTTSMLEITIEGGCSTRPLAQLGLASLRVFIDGDVSLCSALRDLLFTRTLCCFVDTGGERWIRLKAIPISAVGFDDADALIPFKASSHPAYRFLTEYFAFPEKFNFFDIDLATLATHMPVEGQRLTLHLAVNASGGDSDEARILRPLSSKNLLLGCTPVVNLFKHSAVPVDLTHTKVEYPLLASIEQPAAFDIHSIDAVRVTRDSGKGDSVTEFHPYYSMRHGIAGGRNGEYWTARRDDVLAQACPGHEWRLALVNIGLDPLALERAAISIDLTCTNRNIPSTLRVGLPQGDLKLELAANPYPIRLLRKPTPAYRFATDAHWRLISHLALNHRSLVQDQLEAFTEMLALYNLPQSSKGQRQIRGIVGITHKSARAWIRDEHGGARVHGIEVILTLDEEAFVGSGMHAFAQVIDHFLGMYVHVNTFSQLTIISKSTGLELIRCLPRSGDLNLV